jgi:hypothetical protein
MPSRFARRVDLVAPDLVRVARQAGALWLPWPGGPIDGIFCWHRRPILVDFKSGGRARRTARQQELVARGWPIHFPQTVDDVLRLLQRAS